MARRDYAPLPNPQRVAINDRANEEMDGAFESDDEDEVHHHSAVSESTPLTQQESSRTDAGAPSGQLRQNEYDFEAVYDHPPPGSPPPMVTSIDQPAAGNTNGIIPSAPVTHPSNVPSSSSRPSFFRRAVGALLPQHYARVPTSDSSEVPRSLNARGGGIENDGVFSNVIAKPTPQRRAGQGENGDVHVMPEETQKDAPPVSDVL
jgi:hypothetical protein